MTANLPIEMNDQDIEMFIKAFDDFMQHAETEVDAYEKRKEAEEYTNQFFEKKAAEMEVTVDYYMQEFM
jgi:GMP synthase PP-ATPase subunit